MKNIWLVCKNIRSSINVYSFSTSFMKFIYIFENGYLVSLFWKWPRYGQKSNTICECSQSALCPIIQLCNLAIWKNWKNERKNIQFNFSKLNLPLHNLFWQVTHMDSSPLKWKKLQPPSKFFLRTKKSPPPPP